MGRLPLHRDRFGSCIAPPGDVHRRVPEALWEPQARISVPTPSRKPGINTQTARFGVSDLSSRYVRKMEIFKTGFFH
jgi:hypothetical protein